MDILISHFRPYLRQTATRFRLVGMGNPRKTPADVARTTFGTLNFSFIRQGGGFYRRGNAQWQVEAPCVLMQWPGEAVCYGPDAAHGFWEEFYLIYDQVQVPDFLAASLLQPGEICRPMGQPAQIERRIEEIMALRREKFFPGLADRVDMLCELLILESLVADTSRELLPEEQAVRSIHQLLMRNLSQELDLPALVRARGISYSTFRRIWRRSYLLPPRRYLIARRIEKACDLLVKSRLSVGEIAQQTGFQDPLYFSRSFRRETGLSATDYRARYRQPGSD